MAVIRTISQETEWEIEKIKGSRFLGIVCPVPDEAAAEAFVARVRAEHPGATHHCWGYRIDEERVRSSDDGEPSGTAGLPIERRLVGLELEQVALVVVRYYGGTKLGTGGLVRAYGQAATEVLELAEIVEEELKQRVELRFAYDLSGVVESVLRGHQLSAVETSYGVEVSMVLRVRFEDLDEFIRELRERTSGKVIVELDGE